MFIGRGRIHVLSIIDSVLTCFIFYRLDLFRPHLCCVGLRSVIPTLEGTQRTSRRTLRASEELETESCAAQQVVVEA